MVNTLLSEQIPQAIEQNVQEVLADFKDIVSIFSKRAVDLAEANALASLYGIFTSAKERENTKKDVDAIKKEEWSKALKRAKGDVKLALKYYCA